MTVQQLRNTGYKVRVLHNRLYSGYYKWENGMSAIEESKIIQPKIKKILLEPDAKGGSTQVVIDSPNGEHFEGHAICSKKENYNKKLGVKIALGRCGL